MNVARSGHTATLFSTEVNGKWVTKLLVAGGTSDGKTALGTAEIYDPAQKTWTLVNMVHPRIHPTATLLPSGKILLAGGSNGVNSEASAELFDPTTSSFAGSAGHMSSSREFHTATLLVDGQVLLAGGEGAGGGAALTTCDLYSPLFDSFTSTTPFPARSRGTATLLPTNQVLVLGGANGSTLITNAQLFDEGRHQTFTPTLTSVQSSNGKFVYNGDWSGGFADTSFGRRQACGENYPLLVFERAESEATTTQPFTQWSPTSNQTPPSSAVALPSKPLPVSGWHWARVIMNGCPSAAVPIHLP
jgi:hypothetical protein